MARQTIKRLLHHEATAWLVLACSLLLTLLAWQVSNRFLEQDARDRFNSAVQLARFTIQQRMTAYETVLRATAGFVTSSQQVTRDEWRHFSETLHLRETYPGILGLGYAVMVTAAEKESFEQRIRQEGFSHFSLQPVEPARAEYSAILYLEPFDWRNRRAFGFDMLSEPVRAEAMRRARDSGQIAMSGPVTLVQETEQDIQTGTLLYLPIYRPDQPTDTPQQRRSALQGYVYSPFRMGDLMRGILGPGPEALGFELYDDQQPLYRSDPASSDTAAARFQSDVHIEIGGRSWRARFYSRTAFEQATHSLQPLLIGSGGILADLLLFTTLLSISRARRRLQQEKFRFQTLVEATPVAMLLVDDQGWIQQVNSAFEQLFGYRRQEIVGRVVEVLLPPQLHHRHAAQRQAFLSSPSARLMGNGMDLYGIRKDGSPVAVEIALNPIQMEQGHYVLAAVVDISERQHHAHALQERELRYHSVVETTPDGFWLVDGSGRLTEVNRAYCQMSGYSQPELLGMTIPELEARENSEEAAAHIQKVFEQGYDRFESLHRRRDGSLWPVEVTVTVIPQLGDLFVFVRDLTQIKALEAERAKAEEEIRHLAFHDPLTKLPNRRLLLDRLHQELAKTRRTQHYGALLFIDMDHFKQLNDSLGHEMGDLLLVQVAQRLSSIVRIEDTVARLGGDEFVVMLCNLSQQRSEAEQQVVQIGHKLLEVLNQPYALQEHSYQSTPSIGATLFLDDHKVEEILQRADQAMYEVKKGGRNALHLLEQYTPAVNQANCAAIRKGD